MHAENLGRLKETLRQRGIGAALITSPSTVTWLTGYAPPIETGPNPFEGGPAVGWWQEGQLTLVLSDAEAPAAQAQGVEVRAYTAYSLDEPMAGAERQGRALRQLLADQAPSGAIAAELDFLPASLAAVFHDALPGHQVERLDGAFERLKAVKSAAEVAKIRAVLRLCDQAQALMRANLVAGATELGLWAAMRAGLEEAAGGRVPILADLVGGKRTADIGGPPGAYALKPGDALIFDVVPRLDGYWGDNAATYFVGTPAPELVKAYGVVRAALRRAVDAVRPGLKASDLDALLRDAIRAPGYPPYPHHSGHGMGTTYHEAPRIVPSNDLPLEPGMVIALEPGVYLAGVGGIRLEEAVLVTADGCEVLTRHLSDG